MKKLTRRGFTAAGILAALGAGITVLPGCDVAGCSGPFEPSDNEIEGVYGPPEDFGLDPEGDYDPAENELVDVYGPPEDFGLGGEGNEELDPSVSDDFDPAENLAPAVYGPPEDFGD